MVNPNGASSTTQSTPGEEAIGSTTASSTHPAPVKHSVFAESPSAVDPAVKFAQSKEQGNALVKQVSIKTQKVVFLWNLLVQPLTGHKKLAVLTGWCYLGFSYVLTMETCSTMYKIIR